MGQLFLDILSKVKETEVQKKLSRHKQSSQTFSGGSSQSNSDSDSDDEAQAYEYYSTWKAQQSNSASSGLGPFYKSLLIAAALLASVAVYYYYFSGSSLSFDDSSLNFDSMMASGDDAASKAIIKAAATTVIVAGTAFALWRIMGSDFSSVGGGGLRTPKKKTKKKQDAKNVHIYYGSQTGTAETFSNEIKKGCEKLLDERAQVWDMEDFEPDEFIKQKVVVMCLATFEKEFDFYNFLVFFFICNYHCFCLLAI